jgi:hypothetical protein
MLFLYTVLHHIQLLNNTMLLLVLGLEQQGQVLGLDLVLQGQVLVLVKALQVKVQLEQGLG